MEILIPVMALAGMYHISSTKRKKKCNKRMSPPSEPPLEISTITDVVNDYPVQEGFETSESSFESQNLEYFNHNNMIPFNGGKVRGQVLEFNTNESKLDFATGNGSTHIQKTEQAPMFKPEYNIHCINGSQNKTDFMQSRIQLPMVQNNVKPFESEMVGPGLNKGFSKAGSGGFNSGMDSRDMWKPYDVDQLRVSTNPRIEYELNGHQGPAISAIKTVTTKSNLGDVNKNRPNTFFENPPDRWIKTTSSVKGDIMRSIQEINNHRHDDKETNYTGSTYSDQKQSYVRPQFEASKNQELPATQTPMSQAIGKGPLHTWDQQKNSITNYPNNRSTTNQNVGLGIVNGLFKAAVAPIVDLMKPTLKEETIANMRIFGDAKNNVTSSYVKGIDEPKITTKETTLYEPHLYVNNQKEGMYLPNQSQLNETHRGTNISDYIGGASSSYGNVSYESAYSQHNNDIKSSTINNRINLGGTQIYNQKMNVSLADKTSNQNNTRSLAPHVPSHQKLSSSMYGVNHFKRDLEDRSSERLNNDLLSSFRENPYTHSFTNI